MIVSHHRTRNRMPLAASVAALGAILGTASIALSQDAPNQGVAPPQSTDTVNEIQAPPAPTAFEPAIAPAELFYLFREPVAPEDKGSVYTDMGATLAPATPTEYEAMKLAMAREAIERSRSLGLLDQMSRIDPPAVLSTEELQQRKMLLLKAPAAPIAVDPAAGVGAVAPPVQETGPGTLSPAEIQKLEQSKPTDAAPAPVEEE